MMSNLSVFWLQEDRGSKGGMEWHNIMFLKAYEILLAASFSVCNTEKLGMGLRRRLA